MKQIKYSVIIPTYNRSNYILDAINSVNNQSFKNIELIIVDDASSDDTINKIENLNLSVPYKIIKNKQNYGVSKSRNIGVSNSKGDYIAFLDSDDLWEKDKLFKQNAFFEDNQNIYICHTNEKWLKNNKHLNQKKIHKKQAGFFFERSLERCMVSPSAVVIHKSVFLEHGNFDESLPVCEDYDLWLRLNNQLYFGYINEPLVVKRGGHSDQLSTSYSMMDKYRIQSLRKIIKSNILIPENQNLALQMLTYKTKILLIGAIKHKNDELIDFCENFKL